MSTDSLARLDQVTSLAASPRTVAGTGLGASAIVVAALFTAAGPSDDLLIAVGRLAGLYTALSMAVRLVPVARPGRVTGAADARTRDARNRR